MRLTKPTGGEVVIDSLSRRGIANVHQQPHQRIASEGGAGRTKACNLLERLQAGEDDVLRILEDPAAPFTNSQRGVIYG